MNENIVNSFFFEVHENTEEPSTYGNIFDYLNNKIIIKERFYFAI